jgi:protein-L-isoaspartate(D-aspartate) O-methyltransferase
MYADRHALDNDPSIAPALNQALVDGLIRQGYIQSARVEAAFLAVPRHLFLPGVPLEDVYTDQAIPSKTDKDGRVLSASSQPCIMATMLEQLGLEPGHQVLEIGAGTGYNAALMAHIAGETGRVVTVDIDQDIVDGARAHLAAAGFKRVRAVCADGGYGYADSAPYDRIILTVGAWDISPAWRQQLKPDGRLLLPLALKGEQKSIAFEQQDEHLSSVSVRDCGFMTLRGVFSAPHPAQVLQLGPDTGLELWIKGERKPDAEGISGWLSGARRDWDTEVKVEVREIVGGLLLWLALHEEDRGRLVAWDDMVERDVVPPLIGLGQKGKSVFTPVLLGEEGLSGLMRPPGQPAPLLEYSELYTPGESFALFVRQFGPDESLARRLVARVRAWDAAGRPSSAGLRVRAYHRDIDCVPSERDIVVEKRWTWLVLDWPEPCMSGTYPCLSGTYPCLSGTYPCLSGT